MKFLLVAVNAKYIHSNPAVYSLAAYAKERDRRLREKIEIAEYTINRPMGTVLADLYLRKPDEVGFSCYIWNIEYVLRLSVELKKLLPDTEIWLGGPEVSYNAREVLEQYPHLTGVMIGEGEDTFFELASYYCGAEEELCEDLQRPVKGSRRDKGGRGLEEIRGIAFLDECGQAVLTPPRELTRLSDIPFLYEDPAGFENRIIYYESGRGCPFQCSYCLSSVDRSVRFRDLEIVKRELQFFLDHRVKQVKFVDRTFNCSRDHAAAIWRYLRDHDNGVTNFHFEISADLLDEEELELLASMRPGAVQMEIGVQSVNRRTLREIDRSTDLARLKEAVRRLKNAGNIHIHLDLIAGLPYEDLASFRRSFNEVFAMQPEQLQLGFLKVLKGSKMHEKAEGYGLAYSDTPPYEVLFTKWLGYEDILLLKQIEEMTEIYYNSNQYRITLPFLIRRFPDPFAFFEALAEFYKKKGYDVMTPSRAYRYQILIDFAEEGGHFKAEDKDLIREMLTVDYYLREKAKARPPFAKSTDSRMLKKISEALTVQERTRTIHIEPVHYDLYTGAVLDEVQYLVFDYEKRNPLTHEAELFVYHAADAGL